MRKYLTAAFTNRWNLLALFAGVGASLVVPDYWYIALPSVLAAEAAYLGVTSLSPGFRNYVNVQQARSRRSRRAAENEKVVRRILKDLPLESRERYDQLRKQCVELRNIADDLRQPGGGDAAAPLDPVQLEGLDRLLWSYLRLLYTQHALSRFLNDTQVDLIHKDIERLENRLSDPDAPPDPPHEEKLRRTLEDNLATCRARLAHYQKARDNFEFVELEIDRLGNKIKSLAKASIQPQSENFLSSSLDEIAGSLLETEKTMDDLEFATGIGHLSAEPPELIEPTRAVQENRFG